ERRSRTMFAQAAIHVDEVARELASARDAVSSAADAKRFAAAALEAHGARVKEGENGGLVADLSDTPRTFRDAIGAAAEQSTFEIVSSGGSLNIERTHPVVAALAANTLDAALDKHGAPDAARAGEVRTDAAERQTIFSLLQVRS